MKRICRDCKFWACAHDGGTYACTLVGGPRQAADAGACDHGTCDSWEPWYRLRSSRNKPGKNGAMIGAMPESENNNKANSLMALILEGFITEYCTVVIKNERTDNHGDLSRAIDRLRDLFRQLDLDAGHLNRLVDFLENKQ